MASSAIPLVAGQLEPSASLGKLPTYLMGIVQASAGSVIVHDGLDATGTVVLVSNAMGTVGLNDAVACHTGVFVVLVGGATGSLLTEG